MGEHPIENLMTAAMENIRGMVDVNTIVGKPVETVEGYVIIPVSRVSFGFAAGGGEYRENSKQDNPFPFAGGSGAGVSLWPVAFLIVGGGQVRLLPVTSNNALEKLVNIAPEIIQQLKNILKNGTSGMKPSP